MKIPTWIPNLLSGAALGGFIALLIALSTSPVVAPTLSVLVGASVIFLGLSDALPIKNLQLKSLDLQVRLIGFAVAAIVALLIGLNLRATNALGEGQWVRDFQELTEIGIPEAEARKLVTDAYTSSIGTRTQLDSFLSMTTLFAGKAQPADCAEMDPERFADDESLRASYLTGGVDWKTAVTFFDAGGTGMGLRDFLTAAHTALCVK